MYVSHIQNIMTQLKVLIVDDDETCLKLLSKFIKEYSFQIYTATNGIDAIEIFRNNPDIDIILMDIKMPGIDGFEATRRIRQLDENVLVIAQTAYALMGDRQRVIESGCNDYITKPIRKNDLIYLIGQHIDLKNTDQT
jgi:CheY-like chemotaxis protein